MAKKISEIDRENRWKRRSRETRDKLLNAAEQIFLEKGYDNATTREISARADLGAGTFYVHFRDKRAIYDALVRRANREMHRKWLEARSPKMSVEEQVVSALRVSFDYFRDNADLARLILIDGPPVDAEYTMKLHSGIGAELHEILRDGIESDRVSEIEPAILATVFMGIAVVMGRWLLSSHSPENAEEIEEEIIRFCLRGMRPE
ncbi:MAG: TetR/AcrR family transcriptional regulator [Candidatus Abyssobacteria bacterium SURF_5]|uniref:TetR/AcrR family transcriptional regulator n=1 Tax=Abyssobacteria bacterium (strain SURF_5) TaxID=2093360 RepID=A0A3A4P3W7_ABYX5|nr:MAG: TetR/AcrR family transcriptional regulator [Candidatus Abyssubacteria bacterium SURF_5]